MKRLATLPVAVDTGTVRIDGNWRPDLVELASLAIAALLLFAVVVALLLS